jgi:CRP/FNR family transcriptional activator FtrB
MSEHVTSQLDDGLSAEDAGRLAAVPIFAELAPAFLAEMAGVASVAACRHGDLLFRQGQRPDFLHVLLEGEVGLLGISGTGEETIVEIMAPGSVFIEAAALTDQPYLMGAIALKDSRVVQVPAGWLRANLRASPDLALAMVGSLSTHFRLLVREVKELKLKSAAQRLALYLLQQAGRRSGPATVQLAHSKGVIAARIGARAETLSRALARLHPLGVVTRGRTVHIADTSRLMLFCADFENAEPAEQGQEILKALGRR